MQTGDGILYFLTAKVVCCGLLALAAAGLLGGVLGWLFGPGFWLVALLFVGALALIVWFAPPRQHRGRNSGPIENLDN